MEKYKSGRGSQGGVSNNPSGRPKGTQGPYKPDSEKRNKGVTLKFTEEEREEVNELLNQITKEWGLKSKSDTLLKLLRNHK